MISDVVKVKVQRTFGKIIENMENYLSEVSTTDEVFYMQKGA